MGANGFAIVLRRAEATPQMGNQTFSGFYEFGDDSIILNFEARGILDFLGIQNKDITVEKFQFLPFLEKS